jgi:hypothetical protein
MASVHGELALTGFNSTPGDVDQWVLYDGDPVNKPKRVHTFYADAWRVYPWEVRFEIRDVTSVMGVDGVRRILVSVANVSPVASTYGSYNLIWCWTDTF